MNSFANRVGRRFVVLFTLGSLLYSIVVYQVWAQTLIAGFDGDLQRAAQNLGSYLQTCDQPPEPAKLSEIAQLGQVAIRLENAALSWEYLHPFPASGALLPKDLFSDSPSPKKAWTYRGMDTKLRVMTGHWGNLQFAVGRPWEGITRPLHRMRTLLLLTLPLLIVLMFLLIRRLAASLVEPLAKLTQEAEKLVVVQLQQGVGNPGTGDEIQLLAQAFNQVCVRAGQALEARKRFAQDASHQMRTPLARMRADLELSLYHGHKGADDSEILERTLEEVNRLSDLIQQLLKLAQLEEQTLGPSLTRQKLGSLFAQVWEIAEPMDEQHRLSMVLPPCLAEQCSRISPVLMLQFLWNLIDNALKYGDPQQPIILGASQQGQNLRLWVANGGKPPKEIGPMKEPFHRGERTQNVEGWGLGLAICDRIARAHHSKLETYAWHTPAARPAEPRLAAMPCGFLACLDLPLEPVPEDQEVQAFGAS